MIILGIDPGSRITGYGVIEAKGSKLMYLGSGVIKTQPTTETVELPERLKRIYAGVTEIISQFQPECLAVEEVFMAKNASSALKLGQARGVIIVTGANHNLPIFEYSARQVKQTVTGIGSAEKKQVQSMVMRLLNLNIAPQIDASDALAIAITHANNLRYSQSLNTQTQNMVSRYSHGRVKIKALEN